MGSDRMLGAWGAVVSMSGAQTKCEGESGGRRSIGGEKLRMRPLALSGVRDAVQDAKRGKLWSLWGCSGNHEKSVFIFEIGVVA